MLGYLEHHGILGQKWGKRNGTSYPLKPSDHSALERKMARKDSKWAKKNAPKIQKKAERKIKRELNKYSAELAKKYGNAGKRFMTDYSKRKAELLNQNIGDIEAPSGRVLRFVAKRGSMEVFAALADRNDNLSSVRNGLYESGRIAYKKKMVNRLGD